MERGTLHPISKGWLQSETRLMVSADIAATARVLCGMDQTKTIRLPFTHLCTDSKGEPVDRKRLVDSGEGDLYRPRAKARRSTLLHRQMMSGAGCQPFLQDLAPHNCSTREKGFLN